MRGSLIAILLAGPVLADQPISADEFERLVQGRTLSYATGGVPYGAEEYLSGRRVRWSHLDGACEEGRWYEAGGDVCFVYDGIATPQCWRFFLEGENLVAQFTGGAASEVYELGAHAGPLLCPGPEVGV